MVGLLFYYVHQLEIHYRYICIMIIVCWVWIFITIILIMFTYLINVMIIIMFIESILASYRHLLMTFLAVINFILLGDLNADLNTMFESELVDVCINYGLNIADYIMYGRESGQFTYVSDAHHNTSWYDHIVGSQYMYSKLTLIKNTWKIPSSNHLPLSACIYISLVPPSFRSDKSTKKIFKWAKASVVYLYNYAMHTFKKYTYMPINVIILIVDLRSTGKWLNHCIRWCVVRWRGLVG